MSTQAQGFYTAPSDRDTPQQDRGLFDHESQKHQCHHYARMYGGQAVNAMMWGFGATLGADAANAAVGEMRVCCIRGWDIRAVLTTMIAMVETLSTQVLFLLCNEMILRTTLLQTFRRMKVIEGAMSRFAVDIN